MALSLPANSIHGSSFIGLHKAILNRRRLNYLNRISTVVQGTGFVVKARVSDQKIVRRSANYHPTIWKDDFIQSIKSDYLGELCNERAKRLVGEVRMMVDNVMDPLQKLELVDTLQRLGLSYHFENEINQIMLDTINQGRNSSVAWKKHNLYATALEFRLLRQHGYKSTQEVFSSFMDETGNFMARLGEDCQGLLSLYEASYLSMEGESMLEKARDFAAKHLKEYLMKQKHNNTNNKDEYLSMLVDHSLELPLHWRMQRLEARWFIDVYERRVDQIILELAKLDFNIVQAIHQDDLRFASMWWRDLGLREKLPVSRDRLMVNFLWAASTASAPQFRNIRRSETKIISFITAIDDIYDVYGTLDELQNFTEAVHRWDINATKLLPDIYKICFFGLYNSINSIAFDILKENGLDSIHFLKETWADLCKSYLLEAKWYYSGYTPTLQEYLDNASVSIAATVILAHLYAIISNSSTRKDCLESFNDYSNIIHYSSLIFRLADDLGTSSEEIKRGDVPKSIQCYMHESGASEEEAREHMWKLIDAAWKKMNGDVFSRSPSSYDHTFIQFVMNISRIAQCMYRLGDGYGIEVKETKDYVLSLLLLPIPINP